MGGSGGGRRHGRRGLRDLWVGRGARARFRWPVVLEETSCRARGLVRGCDTVRLRPLSVSDESAWQGLRLADDARLRPWEATLPAGSGEVLSAFRPHVREQGRQARHGDAMPFVVEVDGVLAGQLSVAPIQWGSARSATLGYWIGSPWAGRGVTTLAVAMALDHLLGEGVGLHRVEINIRPENVPSLAVVGKLGLREEGLRRRLLHIDGAWADHRSFAVTSEERGPGYVARLEAGGGRVPGPSGQPPVGVPPAGHAARVPGSGPREPYG